MKTLRRALFPATLLLVAALIADLFYLNFLINRRIEEGLLKIPSHIYGRSVEISTGDNEANSFLLNYLDILGYRESNGPPGKGEYRKSQGKIDIYLKDFKEEGLLHKGFSAKIEIDEDTGEITKVSTDEVPLDTLILGVPEFGRISDIHREIRDFVPLEEIPSTLIQAVIAAEDRRFFYHHGIDVFAIGRAFINDIKSMSFKEGGSTITQQLARNFFLSFRKTIDRKVQEIFLAFMLELKFPKEKILELYLNQVYLGQRASEGIYGVGEASLYYFGKEAKDLSPIESLVIAALVKSPNYYSLTRHPSRAIRRMMYIAEGMVKMGYMTREEYGEAFEELPIIRTGMIAKGTSDYITDSVVDLVSGQIKDTSLYYGGYRFYTTIDIVIQKIAEEALSRTLEEREKRYHLEKKLQGAVVIIDNRKGGVLAMVGGRSYKKSQFNRATMAKRQVGSLFKPFVVLSAISHGIEGDSVTLATKVDGSGHSVDTRQGPWLPKNFNNKKYREVTVREILEYSINTGAVALGMRTGLEKIMETGNAVGLGERLKPYPSMILGTFTFSPMDMGYAYAVFPTGGTLFPQQIVKGVYRDGNKVIDFSSSPKKAVKPENAYLVLHALVGTVKHGTGKRLGMQLSGFVAGKTGTTDEGRDSWFVALTKDYTICAWIGFDDGSPTPLTGATGALPVCAKILKKLYRKSPPQPIDPPEAIVFRQIDYTTGLLATSACDRIIREAFIRGTEPTDYCDTHPAGTIENLRRKLFDDLKDMLE